jgi:hypothetical protein
MRAFLSHSSADRLLATEIYRALRDQAVDVWFDRVELRPGDSLLQKIGEGIGNAEHVLVLVTDASRASRWVEKELSIALAREINGSGPRVIPLLLEGCEIPTILADKLYVPVDQRGGGIQGVIPAIFHDSYIADITLGEKDLASDDRTLQENFYEYTRTKYRDLHVHIHNAGFNTKVIDIAERAMSEPGTPAAVVDQIKRISESLPIELPIYWANLSALLTKLLTQMFLFYGKNMDAVRAAVKSVSRSLCFAQYEMCARIRGAVFAPHADQFGHHDIAQYLQRFECFKRNQAGDLVREICHTSPGMNLADVAIEGDPERRIVDTRVLLPISGDDSLMLQVTCAPNSIITNESWYFTCLPQALGRHLQWTAFRETKPLHELDYSMGFSLEDYLRIGFA